MAVEAVSRYFERLSTGDIPGALAWVSKDVSWHQPGDAPISGVHRGREALASLLTQSGQRGVRIALLEQYRCDDQIVCRVCVEHVTGHRFEFELMRVSDGSIDSIRHIGDTAFLRAMFETRGR